MRGGGALCGGRHSEGLAGINDCGAAAPFSVHGLLGSVAVRAPAARLRSSDQQASTLSGRALEHSADYAGGSRTTRSRGLRIISWRYVQVPAQSPHLRGMGGVFSSSTC